MWLVLILDTMARDAQDVRLLSYRLLEVRLSRHFWHKLDLLPELDSTSLIVYFSFFKSRQSGSFLPLPPFAGGFFYPLLSSRYLYWFGDACRKRRSTWCLRRCFWFVSISLYFILLNWLTWNCYNSILVFFSVCCGFPSGIQLSW